MSDNPHKSPHERIFLQYWMDETSWCQDRIDGDDDELDTEYIRLDIHEEEVARLFKAGDAYAAEAEKQYARAEAAEQAFALLKRSCVFFLDKPDLDKVMEATRRPATTEGETE